MKVTVLPVRDPERPERHSPTQPAHSPPGPGGGFEGMHSVSVELLRAERKFSSPARARKPPAASGPAAAVAPGPPAAVEIELPNGRIVRVPQGFSNADLERVLAIAAKDGQ